MDKIYSQFHKIAPQFETVSKEEFLNFINNYPNQLVTDYYMGHITYNDFTFAPQWPDSIVAVREVDFQQPEGQYGRILINLKEMIEANKE